MPAREDLGQSARSLQLRQRAIDLDLQVAVGLAHRRAKGEAVHRIREGDELEFLGPALGGQEPVSHSDVANSVAGLTTPTPGLTHKSKPAASGRNHDFFPDLSHTMTSLGVRQTVDVKSAIEKSMRWHALRLGVMRRLREDASTR